MFDSPQKMIAMIRMSFRSLLLHKLRSLLTILGLVFGVCSVIIMQSIAEGAGLEAQREIEKNGHLDVADIDWGKVVDDVDTEMSLEDIEMDVT